MNHRRRTTASALVLALAAAVLAPTIVIASAQAREVAPDVIDQAGAVDADPVSHTVYVARPTNVGTFSVTDDDILATLGEVTEFWEREAEGRIADFILPTGPGDSAKFTTFTTTASPATVCDFADWDLANQAEAEFDGANFDPFNGGTDCS